MKLCLAFQGAVGIFVELLRRLVLRHIRALKQKENGYFLYTFQFVSSFPKSSWLHTTVSGVYGF